MAEDEGKASTPEPGEAAAAPRPRLNAEAERQPTESSARGSPMATSSGGATPSAAQNAQQQQWRGSPPRGRFGRPYNNGGGRGYFKRHGSQQMLHGGFDGGGAPFQHERVFSRSRGRSVSRSPSRASQQARSRSRSPRSPRSPRSRSRSRSFSPRGHRTFANWERGGRGGGGQYAPGRGGRGGSFDSRQRGRDRDSWARGGGRGGGRYQGFQRASRFVPKDSRYKKGGPMLGNRRSASRDRSSNDGSMPVTGSFRDRQMREREREREREHRGWTRDREGGNRSTSLARTASFSSDYFRDSELSASAEEGEEKPDEVPTPSSEKSAGTQTPSEAGSVDHGSARMADSDVKLNAMSSAYNLPPRPSAGGNRLSTSKELHQPGDDGNIPMDNKLGSSDATTEGSLDVKPVAQHSEFTVSPTEAMEVEEGDKEAGELDISRLMPPVNAEHTLGESQEVRSVDTLDEHVVAAGNAQQAENAGSTNMGSEVASEAFSATRTQEVVDCASRAVSSEEQVTDASMQTFASSEVVTVQEIGTPAAHVSDADNSERRPEEGQEATPSTTSVPVQVAALPSQDGEASVGEESAKISKRMVDDVEDLTQSDGASLAKNVIVSSPEAKEGQATTVVHQEEGRGGKAALSSSPASVPSKDIEMEAASGSLSELLDAQHSTSVEQPVDAATMDVEMKGPESDGGDDAGQLAVVSKANSIQSSPTTKQVIAGPKQATGEPDVPQTNPASTASTEDGDSTAVLDDAEVEEGEMVAPSDDAGAEMEVDDATVVLSKAVVGEVTSADHSLGSSKDVNESVETAKPKGAPEFEEKREKTARNASAVPLDANKDRGKLRSTSFSSPGLPNVNHREGGIREGDKSLFRAASAFSLSSTPTERRGDFLKQRGPPPDSNQKNSQQHTGRPLLDRRASFSISSERSQQSSHFISETRAPANVTGSPGVIGGPRGSSTFPTNSSPPKPFGSMDSSGEGRRKVHRDEWRKDEAIKRGLHRAGSMDMADKNTQRLSPALDRAKSMKGSAANTFDSPSRRSAGIVSDTAVREELPALPDIPLPSGGTRGTSSPSLLGEGTPTKRQRPRLGWGQGLVAASPPQPPKRPRIGWGQGLMQQETDKPSVKTDTAAAESDNADTEVDAVEAGSTQAAQSASEGGTDASASKEEKRPIKLETCEPEAGVIMGDDTGKGEHISEEKVAAMGTSEKEKQQEMRGVTDEAASKVENETDEESKPLAAEDETHDDTESENVSPVKPSKEEILSTIDTLDSNIADVKKQIKALQRTIADAAEVKQGMSTTPETLKMTSALDPAASTEVSNDDDDPMAAESTVEDPPASPAITAQLTAGRHLLSSPVKVAVDSRFVELLAGVFSGNLRKTASANDQLPKRMEQGGVVTKIYRQPSDYPFYQANIDRGLALSDQVRLKVRKRNRLRHDYMKKLARDYVDLKKVWKLRVKKMEKDRKRQDKMRSKQQQKSKQKLKNAELAELNVAGGPVRTTNTSHQSPHVQQLLAAEKAAEAAGGANGDGAGATVRTSSRLTNNSSADLQLKNDLEKIEQMKAQALIDQEIRKKRLKNALSTVIPDMLITPAEREARYFTRFVNGQSCMADGLVMDWKEKEKAEMKVNPWNDLEKCIYMDKFLQFPKNFPRISSFLTNKTTGDVIAFYYRTKKVTDYKALLREQQLRRRGAGFKNTWSCWNLSACAAISLGVQFPQHVARLLLHPTNFRSHQASDNILNSAGAQRLLRDRNVKLEDNALTSGSGTANGLSALSLVSGSDHTPCVRPATSETGVQLDDIANAGDEDTTDGDKFNLYAQQLGQFVAGQQQPFLVDYASLLSDNSYSTGYEVSTLSVAERLKRYPPPSNEIESASTTSGAMRNGGSGRAISADAAQESIATKVKQQSNATGGSSVSANAKNGGSHMTKKELKQQRKLKKMEEGAAAAAAVAPASTATSSQLSGTGNTGGEKSGNHSRKKSAGPAASSNAGAASGNRNTPRVSIPGEEKAAQGGKKGGRGGAGTPGSRRNSHPPQGTVGTASPKVSAVVTSTTATVGLPSVVMAGAATMKPGSGNAAPFGSAGVAAGAHQTPAMAPSATGAIGGGSSVSAPTKRVVQKWTEAEKADFLKFFSLYGKDWTTLTESIPTKTAAQIKNYYQNYKNRLNLQDILKRRIENAAAGGSGVNMPSTAAAAAARGGTTVSPRTAAAGLMNTSLRQSMGGSVGLSSGLSAPMPGSSSMAMSGSDANISFQAALNAVQPGLQPAGMRSELSASHLDMQMHQDQQQQQSREMTNPVSNSERYLKLLNMQHQLQIMQLQQHQKSQAMASEAAGGGNSSPYHDGQLNAANAQRLMQFSRHPAGQQQQQLPPQMSLEALQQMGLQPHLQASPHSHMMQLPMQQQQARGSYAEMAHPSSLYHSMTQMQAQHSHAMAATNVTAQMGMSPTSTHRYDGMVDPEGNVGRGGANSNSPSNLMAHRDISQRAMLNLAMMNNATSSGGGAALQPIATNSPCQPAMGPPRSMAMKPSSNRTLERGQPRPNVWQSGPPPTASTSTAAVKPEAPSVNTTTTAAPRGEDTKGRSALAAPAPPSIQPVRSRMSFSSILNESESPREDTTPRGDGSMVIKQQQESPRASQQQQQQQQPQQQMRLEQVRAMPPSSATELARSPVSAPSPTAHLLPRRPSVPTGHSRMGLMSNLLNVPSPERRTSSQGRQSPLMQQQQVQQQMQAARYYDVGTSGTDGGQPSSSRASIATMVSGMPVSSSMSSAMMRASGEKMASVSSVGGNYGNTSTQMAVALSRSGSGSSSSSAVSANAPPSASPHGQQQQQQQQQMWNYPQQIRYEEEAELLRRAQRAEEEAARAAAAAAAAARALQEAQQARQEALDMAANMARYNSALQQQQAQQQAQQQQAQQYQQVQQYQQQLQAHQQQQFQQQQQHEYHQQQAQQLQQQQQHAQQLHQQQLQHQALHHHLQMMQQQHQQQRPANVSPSDHLLQQQQQQQQMQQQPPRAPPSDRER